MERGPEQGLGRLVLKALAITSALTFLTAVMVNACATASRPAAPPTYGAPTKAAPVLPPGQLHDDSDAPGREPPLDELEPPQSAPLYAPATKSLTVIPPRPLVQPAEETPRKSAPQQQGPR
jgi:hypothetical protein